jgi:hypothetical protein
MNRIITILAIVLFYPICGKAGTYKQQWDKATLYYIQKQYDSAVYYFELVAASKPQNTEVYYNLGNSYYRLNRIGLSILNYQRALHIDPSNKRAEDNLSVAQARISHQIPVTEDIFFIVWWHNITSHTKATGWTVAALIAFLLIIATLWVRRFSTAGAKVPIQAPGILGFICIVFLLFGFVAAGKAQQSPGAVIMENDTPLMNASLKGKPAALLPEGVTIKVISEQGTWVEVSLPDGRTGWVQQAQIGKI